MITFHGDHLVSPVLCEILSNSIPAEVRVPVVFHANDDGSDGEWSRPRHRTETLGVVTSDGGIQHIEIFLENIFRITVLKPLDQLVDDPGAPSFRTWKTILEVCLHEFGHVGDHYLWDLPRGAYVESLSAHTNAEDHAEHYAYQQLARLVSLDKRLFQPRWLGYLSIRIQKILGSKCQGHWGLMNAARFSERGWLHSGGQLSPVDVARLLGVTIDYENEGFYTPDSRLINHVASDLALVYTSPSGRRYSMYTFGDLPEIARRVTVYRIQCDGKIATERNSSLPRLCRDGKRRSAPTRQDRQEADSRTDAAKPRASMSKKQVRTRSQSRLLGL